MRLVGFAIRRDRRLEPQPLILLALGFAIPFAAIAIAFLG